MLGCTRAPAAPTATIPAAGATAFTSRSPTATPAAVATPDVERVLTHARMLAGTIGIRAAGTDGERAAAKYIAGVLQAAGYDATIEPFTFTTRFDDSKLEYAGTSKRGAALDGSPNEDATGALVVAGLGRAEDFAGLDAKGHIALVRRGEIPFATKAANARNAGAVAVVIANDRPGPFGGTLGTNAVGIPVIGVDGATWDQLSGRTGETVTARATTGTRSVDSQNVVGRRGGDCRAYLGGHYDSVPAGPGANDNASGTSTMLELARVRPANGLCVVAFGAEEVGLFGSQAFVKQHLVGGAQFMLNFDMAGRIEHPIIVGDDALTATIVGILAKGSDDRMKAGKFPPFASSDHVSFISVGVPAVTITSGDDPGFIHTPRDTVEHLDRDALAFTLGTGDTVLSALLKTLDTPAR